MQLKKIIKRFTVFVLCIDCRKEINVALKKLPFGLGKAIASHFLYSKAKKFNNLLTATSITSWTGETEKKLCLLPSNKLWDSLIFSQWQYLMFDQSFSNGASTRNKNEERDKKLKILSPNTNLKQHNSFLTALGDTTSAKGGQTWSRTSKSPPRPSPQAQNSIFFLGSRTGGWQLCFCSWTLLSRGQGRWAAGRAAHL